MTNITSLSAAVAFGIGLCLSGCQINPTPDDGWEISPVSPSRHPRTIPGKRVRQIEYKGHCLASAGGKCWPCAGGEVRDCDEWYQIIDDLADAGSQAQQSPPRAAHRAGNLATAGGMQGWPGVLPGSDIQDFIVVVSAILDRDGVAWDRSEILNAYQLSDPLPLPFTYRASLLSANTDTETFDMVVFAREDQVLPESTAGLTVEALPLGELGLEDPGPIALRITGHIAVFAEQAEALFPIGTYVDFENEYGPWHMEAVAGPNGEYAIELRLGGVVVGVW